MTYLCRRSNIGVCRGAVCVSDLCQVRVSYKKSSQSVLQECPERVSHKRVLQECQVRSVK